MTEFVFTTFRKAIVDRIKEAMPKEIYVFEHEGDVDDKQLKSMCKKTPAIFVSILKVLGLNRAKGQTAAEVRIGVYLVTSHINNKNADEIALNILPRLLNIIDGEDWDLDFTENRPEQIDAENLYSGLLEMGLISLWGISFKQRLLLPELYTFEAPTTYPNDPNHNTSQQPWNDPITDFLRTCATHETENLDCTGMFNVQAENKGNNNE